MAATTLVSIPPDFSKKRRRTSWLKRFFVREKSSPHPSIPLDQPSYSPTSAKTSKWRKTHRESWIKPPTLVDKIPTDQGQEYKDFIQDYPEYTLTHPLDALRVSDFRRVDESGETYVDYMGGSLYPESLITKHADFLKSAILGNTHSINNSSQSSFKLANEARSAVLAFFHAPPEYTVIFTANASAALKLVGESYPFHPDSTYVLAVDSHNSVNGIREYATAKGALCAYIPSTLIGGFNPAMAKAILMERRPHDTASAPSLFALTGRSNVSNWNAPMDIADYASSLGYHVLLDGAALAPTSTFSLTDHPVDAMAISFYKMFGFPTGVGALIVKKSFLGRLKRPWFSGGTVEVVQVPGIGFTRAAELHEQFEDGTINYTMLPAITEGLQFLTVYLPYLPLRLSCLLDYLISSLARLQHDSKDAPVVRILSKGPNPAHRIRAIGEQSDVGFLVSLVFLDPSGSILPNSFVEYAASLNCISLRTGCMCNLGGAMAILGMPGAMDGFQSGETRRESEKKLGMEIGVVRVSLGLASNFEDVRRVIQFASVMADSGTRDRMYTQWTSGSQHES